MTPQEPDLKSKYDMLSDLKKQHIERAKRDTGFFRETVLINQLSQEIKCEGQVRCFDSRLITLEKMKTALVGVFKFIGILSIIVGIIVAMVKLFVKA